MIIKEVDINNFLYGGFVYHHKEVVDEDERTKMRIEYLKNLQDKATEDENDGDIFLEFTTKIKNIMSSQSLTETMSNKLLQKFNREEDTHPLVEVYDNNNIFVKDKIIPLKGDIIIFMEHRGIVGNIFNHNIPNQKLYIKYDFDHELDVMVGRIFEGKLIEDFRELTEALVNGGIYV
ncbi:hypothetical protein [uncultured Cetobacterium sp.]|uniref:hypothetical protein n=1 Tax=uncultured Cetobacterium sp. TaxID=527638 RepID=UPI0026350F95|nr:hypothetical protein [uncultured Cetobacterium sp.]